MNSNENPLYIIDGVNSFLDIFSDNNTWREHKKPWRRNQRPPVTGWTGALLCNFFTFTILSSPVCCFIFSSSPLWPHVSCDVIAAVCFQAQTTLKVYNMNSDRLQKNLETAGEEKALLQESNAQVGLDDKCRDLHFLSLVATWQVFAFAWLQWSFKVMLSQFVPSSPSSHILYVIHGFLFELFVTSVQRIVKIFAFSILPLFLLLCTLCSWGSR